MRKAAAQVEVKGQEGGKVKQPECVAALPAVLPGGGGYSELRASGIRLPFGAHRHSSAGPRGHPPGMSVQCEFMVERQLGWSPSASLPRPPFRARRWLLAGRQTAALVSSVRYPPSVPQRSP